MRLIDISMAIEPGMPVLPGDPRVTRTLTQSIDRGDRCTVSRIEMGSHTGTHVDPPSHFLAGGATIDRIDLDLLNGPCQVHQVADELSGVGAEEIRGAPVGTTRLLLKTRNSAQWDSEPAFFPGYVALTEAGAREALSRGIRLIGIDSLSIEPGAPGGFPVHRMLLEGGALILEGLRLSHVAPGAYRLGCLPLRLKDGDGGPARAVLFPL